jgi:hypothetical protein
MERRNGPRSSFRGFVLLQLERAGSLVVVTVMVFMEVGLIGEFLDCANPTLEQMAQHWFHSFGTNPSAESFAHLHAHF